MILPGTWVVSDGWAAYGGIANLQQQYKHDVVNHSVNFVNPNDKRIHTQSIESTWGALKSGLKSFHGISETKLTTYLFSYMFRRYHQTKLLNRLIYEMNFYRKG